MTSLSRYTIDELYNDLTYDSEKWGEALVSKTSENLVTLPNINWSYGCLAVDHGMCQDRTNLSWRHTPEYISVSAGSKIYIRGSFKADTSVAMIALYNSEKEYLPYTINLVEGDTDYTVPEDDNIAFVRFCLGNEQIFEEQEIYIETQVPVSTPKDNIDNIYEQLNDLEKEPGEDGADGITPHIGANGNWFMGDTDTGLPSRGEPGEQGPQGEAGEDGADGITPHIGENGNWWIGDTDTGIPARGPQGDPGTNSESGGAPKNVWYGTGAKAGSSNQYINVTTTSGDFVLADGNMVYVKLTSKIGTGSQVSLNVDGVGSIDTDIEGSHWCDNEIVGFVYSESKFLKIDAGTATTQKIGKVLLSSSLSSDSLVTAATSSAVKNVYTYAKSIEDVLGGKVDQAKTAASEATTEAGEAKTLAEGAASEAAEAKTLAEGASPTGHTHSKSEITDFPTSMTPTAHTHSKSDITDFPTEMTPTEHDQSASTITAGTFAGQVVAKSSAQTPGTALLRNSKIVSADTTPSNNGEICWTYK